MGVVYNLDKCRVPKYESVKPPLYIITPTYPRPVQLAELTRLAYLLQVRYFWGIHFFLIFQELISMLTNHILVPECQKFTLDCCR